jgi:hypothetical protein
VSATVGVFLDRDGLRADALPTLVAFIVAPLAAFSGVQSWSSTPASATLLHSASPSIPNTNFVLNITGLVSSRCSATATTSTS